jgi:acyl-CoA synthetase (AMP-forming)/AMP-acid ligase II
LFFGAIPRQQQQQQQQQLCRINNTTMSPSSSSTPSSLLDRLQCWALKYPNKTALSFLDDHGEICRELNYFDLARRSSLLAIHLLQQHHLKAGDRVLLVYPPSLDFIVAFLACLKAGIIAVPCYPPDPKKLNKDLKMFATIVSSCDAKAGKCQSYRPIAVHSL